MQVREKKQICRGKGIAVLLGLFLFGAILPGCSRPVFSYRQIELEETSETEEVPETEETAAEPIMIETEPETETDPEEQEPRVEKDGMIRSYLTGEMVPVSQGNRRPLAIMMSNDKAALPQYGINRAGVVYEAPVEGSMNRYMAIIEDYDDLNRIGSVRSCRTYYTYFAREFDAIYAHFGQSTFAKPYLENVDNINGIEGIGGTAYYRAKDRRAPHNAYASADGISRAIDKLGYSREYDEDYHGHFLFARTGMTAPMRGADVRDAWKVTPGYPLNDPWFEYNEEDGLYYRYQYGAPHNGNEGQIAVKNIIIQYCSAGYYATTEYRNINVHESSWGYYISNGQAEDITWEKDGEFGVTHYYDATGKEIVLNPGKTWICIATTNDMKPAKIEGRE